MAMKIGYIMVYDLEIFQSTRPVRGGTITSLLTHRWRRISIHPPRAGRDVERLAAYEDTEKALEAIKK